MDVIVTGSAGFLGSAVTRTLRDQGHVVRGLDVRNADIVADIGMPGSWQDQVRGDVVIHTAAAVGMPSDAAHFWRINTLGTRHVLDAALANGVRRFVLFSSVTVFGNDFPDQVTEDYPTRPTGVPYADSKIAAEHLCLDAHIRSGIEIVAVRPGDVYGPGSRPWTLLPLEMIRSRRVAVPTTGIHSPVYVSDVVAGVVRAAQADSAAGQIITLSGGVGVPTAEYFDRYAQMLGRGRVPRLPRRLMLTAAGAQASVANRIGRPVELSPAAARYLADRRGTYSIAKAAEVLDWRPEVSLDEGMARTQQWLTDQGLLGEAGRRPLTSPG